MLSQEHRHLQGNWQRHKNKFTDTTCNIWEFKKKQLLRIWLDPFPWSDLQVNTVGISAPNMMKSIEKKRNPVLLKTLLASLPMLRYSRPIKTPMATCEISLRWVKTWGQVKTRKEKHRLYAVHSYDIHNTRIQDDNTILYCKYNTIYNIQTTFWTDITHLVSADSYEGSLKEDAELRQCTCGKTMALYVSSILQKIDKSR